MRFYRVLVGVPAAVNAAVGLRTEPVHLADELGERGFGGMLVGHALNKHPVVGRTVLPAGSGIHVGELAFTQRLSDLAQGGAFTAGFHDEVREAGDVVGVGTNELGHW